MPSDENAVDNDTRSIDAQSFLDVLRRHEALIPGFAPLTTKESMSLRKVATLNPEWINTTVNAIGASPVVETAIGSTYEGLRHEMADMVRWEEVEQELRVLLAGVTAANLKRRHRLGSKALQAYGILRQLIRQPEHQHLIPFVNKLKQMNKLGKRKPKKDAGAE